MKLSLIVAQLRARCPVFGGRVAAGIDWEAVANSSKLAHPSAYVIASADDASENDVENGVRQNISDGFDVIVVLDTADERGQEAADALHDIRSALWRALVGWRPGSEYDPATYDGGSLVFINRARVVYNFGFVAQFQLGRTSDADPAETWHELELDGLPMLEGFDIDVDCIDPADRNLKYPGPDGRIEIHLKEDMP